MNGRRRTALRVIVGVVALAFIVAVGVGIVFAVGTGPDAEALAAVEDAEDVTVERVDAGVRVSNGPITAETVGVVYYPGARVNAESYVPTAAEVVRGSEGATRDVVVVIPDMPLNLAVFGADRADEAIASTPAVESWYVGGHSLGGAMACRYAANNDGRIEGLVLHAAYCDRDVSGTDLRVLSVLGAADGVIDAERERARRALLPAEAAVVELDELNHAGFGAYGTQRGDEPAPTTPGEMRRIVGNVTGEWLVGNVTGEWLVENPPTPDSENCVRPARS